MFTFKEQNEIGKRGEAKFLEMCPEWSANNVGARCKEPDFVNALKQTLELKFDVSTRARRDDNGFQSNFFIETISNDTKGTLGGVHRAAQEGVDIYAYMFETPFRIFFLDVKKAVSVVDKLVDSGCYRKCSIKNRFYNTTGYPLPIAEFKECMTNL